MDQTTQTPLTQEQMIRRNKNKKIAVCWMTIPFLVILAVTFVWAIARFTFSAIGGSEIVGRIINFILSGVGLIAMIMLPIGIIIGVIYLVKK